MKTYTIEKNAMKAVKSILSRSEKAAGPSRGWTKYAYLYEKGLILTDGVRLLRIHDTDLELEFGSFIRETGRVVLFSLEGDSLKMEHDVSKNDSEVGMMERLIPSEERIASAYDFTNRFTEGGKTAKVKDISKSMVNASILTTRRWFDPERFDGMGIRPWSKISADGARVTFVGENSEEVLIIMGTGWEDFS